MNARRARKVAFRLATRWLDAMLSNPDHDPVDWYDPATGEPLSQDEAAKVRKQAEGIMFELARRGDFYPWAALTEGAE